MKEFKKLCACDGYSLYGLESCRFLTAAVHDENLTLEKSWAYPGIYVFVTGSAEKEAFIKGLLELWRRAGEGLLFLWLPGSDFHTVHGIFARADTQGCARPGARRCTHAWGLDFSGYGMAIPQGTIPGCDGDGFVLDGRVGFEGAGVTLTGQRAVIHTDGSIEFSVRHEGGFDLAAAFDSGIKFSFDYRFEDEDEAREHGFLLTASNSVIRAQDAMSLRVQLEPLHEKLQLSLPENQIFKSHIISISGRAIALRSLAGACWTLARTATHRYEGSRLAMRYYLTLAGSFEPLFNGSDRTILPGLTGTEYFDFSDVMSRKLTFEPDGGAYFGEIDKASPNPSTAWVCYPPGTAYYSQPGEAPLFAPEETPQSSSSKADVPADGAKGLTFLSIPLLKLAGSVSVPQIFYRALSGLPGTGAERGTPEGEAQPPIAEDLETTVYEERFRILSKGIKTALKAGKEDGKGPDPDMEAGEIRAVSPQGLMTGVKSGAWAWISLANVGTKTEEKLLVLQNVDLALRREFAHIDMNLVFEGPDALLPYVKPGAAFAFSMEGGWRFDLHPSRWDSSSLLIIKYGRDSTVRSLAKDKEAFKHALEEVNDRDGRPSDDFRNFLDVIDDPEFTGVLALGVLLSADTEQMDRGVKTMWLGIPEADRFAMRAHHLILRHTKVIRDQSGLFQQAAAVDGVAAYRAKKGISYGSEYHARDYDYQTTGLTLCCKNSRLERLATESELLINTIAGSRCSKEGGNCLTLDGRADITSGLDGFSFALRSEGCYRMNSPLEAVKITHVSLAGESVFSLDGSFYFVHDRHSDLFSFGFDEGEDYGLGFMGWKLTKGSGGVLTAGYGDIVLTRSQPRINSWADRFPVGVDVFCHDTAHLPDWHGYTNVLTTLRQEKLTAPWYGVRYRVPLGSLGDLSENTMLDLHILIAFGGGDSPGLYVGARLPGAVSGGGIDVQGLIKLGFDTISLDSEPETDSDAASEPGRLRYRLRLKQFTARFLWASFPPGRNEIVIEGDESGEKLGWYGYYREKEEESGND